MRWHEPSFSTGRGECRTVHMPSSNNVLKDSTWSWQPSSCGIPWNWHEPLRSCEVSEDRPISESFTFGLDRLLDGIAMYIAKHRPFC